MKRNPYAQTSPMLLMKTLTDLPQDYGNDDALTIRSIERRHKRTKKRHRKRNARVKE